MVDIWSGWDDLPKGAKSKMELVRYTFPYKIIAYTAFKSEWSVDDVNKCLVDSFLLGGYYGFNARERWSNSLNPAVQQYIRIRRELRKIKAPGYPQGYRDIIGLSVENPNLIAKSYHDETGITIIYHAKKDVNTKIAVDGTALGLPKIGKEVFQVKLLKGKAAYKIFKQ
jgi:hypothetical protein